MASGIVLILHSAYNWSSVDPVKFFVYLAAFLLASGLKVRLPGINGTMSVNQVFIFLGVVELGLPETMIMGCAGGLVQTLWHAKHRPKLIQVLFNLASMAISIGAAYQTYHAQVLGWESVHLSIRLLASAASFFVTNTLAIALVIGFTEGRSAFAIWRESYFWSFPYYLVGASLAGGLAFVNQHFGWQASLLALPALFVIYRSYCLYLGRLEAEKLHVQDVANLHLRTIEALAAAIEAKDETTHCHLERVQTYALEMGKVMGLEGEELQALHAASLLHDIGKLAVPEHIISKPGKLTPEEFEKMKIHPVVGAEILERVQFPYPVAPIVRHHHEKWNGAGYPDGISGEEIPIGARILSAADCLDALASDRQYRRALPLDKAMDVVVSESGKSCDPKVVEILRANYRDWEEMAKLRSPTREKIETDIQVARGNAPAAGFESSGAVEGPDDDRVRDRPEFLSSIASARQEGQTLYELSQDLGSSLSLKDTLSVLDTRLQRLVQYDCICVYIKKDDCLVAEHVRGVNASLFQTLRIPVGEGLSGWVIDTKKPIVNGNPSVEAGYLHDPSKFSTLRSALAVPLKGTRGELGVLALYQAAAGAFTKDDLRILLAIGPKVSLAIENAISFQDAQVSATTDGLTGLPNARSLFLHLDAAVSRCHRSNEPLTVLVLDLDNFKVVNDQFGHLAGNEVLKQTANRFRVTCREHDYVARMGGDEFVVLLPGCSRAAAEKKRAKLDAEVRAVGIDICGREVISASIGAACYPDDGSEAEELLAEADRRMYEEKKKGKAETSSTAGLLALMKHAGQMGSEEDGAEAAPAIGIGTSNGSSTVDTRGDALARRTAGGDSRQDGAGVRNRQQGT